jgi:streptogramin lyase
MRVGVVVSVTLALVAPAVLAQHPGVSSAAVLAQLPDGETKRRFIIDCTNCHQIDLGHAYPEGKPRSAERWTQDVARMIGFAGATSGFPIMSARRNADSTAAWLSRTLTSAPTAPARHDASRATVVATPNVVEYLMPNAQDLPHDIAVDSSGQLLVTGMFSHTLHVLDTASKSFSQHPIPVERSNPRAIEIAANGDWWVLLGSPNKVARYEPSARRWSTFDVGMYGHSVALTPDGKAWFNGHFTRDPEQLGYVEPASSLPRKFDVPSHPTMAKTPGGPIPYELRTAPDGRIWMSELQGNRIVSFDPRNEAFEVYDLPTTVSAPRRLDVDGDGVVWIPAYAANALVRFDPRTRRFQEFELPVNDAVPYIARVDARRQLIWIGTNASDEVYAFDPRAGRFTIYPLPSRGAVVRHLVVDPRNGDIWLAYGASPGIPARIARLRP